MRIGTLYGFSSGNRCVHVEEIAVAFANCVLAQPLDRVGEIQVHAQPALAHAAAFIAHRLRVARGHVARHQIAEARILAARDSSRAPSSGIWSGGRLSPLFFGTQMRPSLRSDSDISVSFD